MLDSDNGAVFNPKQINGEAHIFHPKSGNLWLWEWKVHAFVGIEHLDATEPFCLLCGRLGDAYVECVTVYLRGGRCGADCGCAVMPHNPKAGTESGSAEQDANRNLYAVVANPCGKIHIPSVYYRCILLSRNKNSPFI